jgi:nicotinate-nucleotide pyrophosphorylase (carboxylating)
MIEPLEPAVIREAATRALGEDRGPVDITSWVFVPETQMAQARIVTREACVLSGLPVALRVFQEENIALVLETKAQDGDALEAGAEVLRVAGSARSILTAERSALNFLQHLSGIATRTREFVCAVEGTKAKILDTRKTIPGLRLLAKYAVRCGGGVNHRFGLYDHYLIKDNHLAAIGGVEHLRGALAKARAMQPEAKLEAEADTLEQVTALVEMGVDIILLDNMSLDQMREAVKRVGGRAKTEASGNVTLERVRLVAECGVDYISVGALTHTVRAIDFSLEF